MRVVRTLLCGHLPVQRALSVAPAFISSFSPPSSSRPFEGRLSSALLSLPEPSWLHSLLGCRGFRRDLLRRDLLGGGFLLRYFLCRSLLGCTLLGCRGFSRGLLCSFRGHSFLDRSRFLRRSRFAYRRSSFACRLLGRDGTASFCRRRLLGHILFGCWFFNRRSPDVRHRHLFGSPSVVCPPWVSRLFSLGRGRLGWFGFNGNRLFHVLAFLAVLLFIGLHFDLPLFVYRVRQGQRLLLRT